MQSPVQLTNTRMRLSTIRVRREKVISGRPLMTGLVPGGPCGPVAPAGRAGDAGDSLGASRAGRAVERRSGRSVPVRRSGRWGRFLRSRRRAGRPVSPVCAGRAGVAGRPRGAGRACRSGFAGRAGRSRRTGLAGDACRARLRRSHPSRQLIRCRRSLPWPRSDRSDRCHRSNLWRPVGPSSRRRRCRPVATRSRRSHRSRLSARGAGVSGRPGRSTGRSRLHPVSDGVVLVVGNVESAAVRRDRPRAAGALVDRAADREIADRPFALVEVRVVVPDDSIVGVGVADIDVVLVVDRYAVDLGEPVVAGQRPGADRGGVGRRGREDLHAHVVVVGDDDASVAHHLDVARIVEVVVAGARRSELPDRRARRTELLHAVVGRGLGRVDVVGVVHPDAERSAEHSRAGPGHTGLAVGRHRADLGGVDRRSGDHVLSPHRDERPGRAEDLDPVVAGVGDVDVSCAVDGHGSLEVADRELPGSAADRSGLAVGRDGALLETDAAAGDHVPADRPRERAVGVDLLQPVVAGLDDVEVAGGVERGAHRVVHAPAE